MDDLDTPEKMRKWVWLNIDKLFQPIVDSLLKNINNIELHHEAALLLVEIMLTNHNMMHEVCNICINDLMFKLSEPTHKDNKYND